MNMMFDASHIGCREFKLFLYDYADRNLDPRLLMALDAHVISCTTCQATIDAYRKSGETARKIIRQDVKIPGDLKDILIEKLNKPEE